MKRLAGAVCMTPSLEGGCDGPAFRRSKWGALRRRELLAGAGAAIAGTAVAAERADAFPPAETGGTRATPGASRPTRRSTTTTSGWWLKGRRAMQQTDLSRAASCIATDDGERQIRMDDRLPAAHSLAMAGPAATLLLASLLSARSLRGGEPAGGPSSLEERARPPTTIALHRAPVSILGVCRAAQEEAGVALLRPTQSAAGHQRLCHPRGGARRAAWWIRRSGAVVGLAIGTAEHRNDEGDPSGGGFERELRGARRRPTIAWRRASSWFALPPASRQAARACGSPTHWPC